MAGKDKSGDKSKDKGTRNFASVTEQEALDFHARGRPGKLEIAPTKPMATQRDLSLAYSPGVAVPVKAIADDPSRAYDYTTRGNMVAVISNGTAISASAISERLPPSGDGRQVRPLQALRGCRFHRPRSRHGRPDEFINCVRFLGPLSAASIWKTSRPGMLHHRAAPARDHGYPGFP